MGIEIRQDNFRQEDYDQFNAKIRENLKALEPRAPACARRGASAQLSERLRGWVLRVLALADLLDLAARHLLALRKSWRRQRCGW